MRPPAANRAELPVSAEWWDTHDFPEIKAESERLRKSGDYYALESLYRTAIAKAHALEIVPAEVSYRTALANTYTILFRYTDALEEYQAARALAERNELWEMAGAVAPGISSVYNHLGDDDAALEAAQQGLAATQHLHRPTYFEAALRLQLARLSRDGEATIRDAIAAARARDDPDRVRENATLEATGWDLLGDHFIAAGDFPAAQEALAMGLRLRQKVAPRQARSSFWRLATLRRAQALQTSGSERERLLDAAERFNQMADKIAFELERPVLRHQRGLIEADRGRPRAALEHFRAAVETIGKWRSAMPLAASSLAATDQEIHQQILHSFVEAAAHQSLATNDPALARDSFLAAEHYRAASLRHTRDLAPIWRDKLPARYWIALGELRTAESTQIEAAVPNKQVDRLRLEITEMEAYASVGVSLNQHENFFGQTSLILFQHGLGSEELLLSFHLGAQESFLWALQRDGIQLYRLPPAAEIADRVQQFRDAVLRRRPVTGLVNVLGSELYQILFGQLSRAESAKEWWLLSLEGSLFDLPFAALRADGAQTGTQGGGSEYLVQGHTLQVVPGALLLGKRSGASGDRYLAVGDPIYNVADPRFQGSRAPGPGMLNRLAASEDEIRRSAAAWSGPTEILEGDDARRDRITRELRAGAPATLHFSTHVVQDTTRRGPAFLALSLGPHNTPDLLAATDVALLDIQGSLVVMTGCASGTGEIVAGAGLLGLTRGWLVAGASSVVATAWPVRDARGDVIPNFFGYLRELSPAAALRRSQIEAIHSATWQADPAYWASFQVTGGTR